MERSTYTIEEVAKMLGIGRSSAYQAVRVGEIPTIRIGRRLLVPRLALEKILGCLPEALIKNRKIDSH
jgi:excisionase family DNA binding protein